jgi:hypothetical protein
LKVKELIKMKTTRRNRLESDPMSSIYAATNAWLRLNLCFTPAYHADRTIFARIATTKKRSKHSNKGKPWLWKTEKNGRLIKSTKTDKNMI